MLEQPLTDYYITSYLKLILTKTKIYEKITLHGIAISFIGSIAIKLKYFIEHDRNYCKTRSQ